MIRDLDATLVAWLSELAPYATVTFDPPPASGGKDRADHPALLLRLVDIQENQAASSHTWASQRSEEGHVTGRMPPNRVYRFSYLMTAVAADTMQEHELLGALLAGLAREEVVPRQHLQGVFADSAPILLARCAPERVTDSADVKWPGWHIAGRTPLELSVMAPLPSVEMQGVAAAPSRLDLAVAGTPRRGTVPPAGPRRPTARITED